MTDEAAARLRDRQRSAYETLLVLTSDIGVFAGIARAVATGLSCRGAGVARWAGPDTPLTALGLWFDGEPLPAFESALPTKAPQADELRLPPPFDAGRHRDRLVIPLNDNQGQPIGLLFAVDDALPHDDPDLQHLLKIASACARTELMREASAARNRENDDEQRMRFALEAGALGLWEWDVETDTYVVNERWAEIRGYKAGEVHPNYTDWHPDEQERLQPIVDAVMSGRIDSYEIDYRTPDRDGNWRWVNARTKVIRRGPDGRPQRIIGVQTDIHERRLAEEAARANAQWLELAVDATELGLWDWRAADDRLLWSPRCASMLGYTQDELPPTAKAWIALNHPDDQAEAGRQFRLHVRGDIPQIRVEIRCRARDGRWVWILSNGRVIERDAQGRAVRAVGTHQDISQLKNAELALRESEARLRTVVDNSPIGIFLADTDGSILYSNPAILRLHGSAGRSAQGYDWLRLVHDTDRDRISALWRAFLQAPEGVFDVEWRAAQPPLLIRVRASAIHEQARVLGFAGTLEDITDQRAAEERERALERQLQQAQKIEAIGTLSGGIAHDFNNSLATILGFAMLAQGRPTDDRKLAGYLDTIVRAGEHSRDLVRKLLAFSRSTPAGEVTTLDAAPRVTDAVHMLKAVIPTTIRIDTDIDDDVPHVRIDATDLHQLIFNLALNARDAISGHGEIRFTLRETQVTQARCAACHREFDGRWIELAITDTGTGIAADDVPRIFDPFYSTKEVGMGTGMGLSVIHGIVHRVGGHLLVESTPGRGTVMRVLLRAGERPPRIAAATAGVVAPSAAERRPGRVLVVDDEPTIVSFLCEWLETEGHIGEGFTDPVAARAWADRDDVEFDALITDQTMPRMTGLELAGTLRRRRPQLPVIVCTGLADRVSAEDAQALGIAQLCLKPVPLPELQAVLRRVMPGTAGAGADP